MNVDNLPFNQLDLYIREHFIFRFEDEKTKNLIKRFASVRKVGYLTKEQLIEVCYWKSPRVLKHIRSNSPKQIKSQTMKAFESKSERLRIEHLTLLKGVGVPMASAVLMITNPKRYPVIDIRVWELLYKYGVVSTNRRGSNFTFDEWLQFITIVRSFASKHKISARSIERILFETHKKQQVGNLYK